MKHLTFQKTETIETTYWACNDSEHRHRMEQAAQQCIDASLKRKAKPTPTERTARTERIFHYRFERKMTLKAIGAKLNLSATRISYIIEKELSITKRKLQRAEHVKYLKQLDKDLREMRPYMRAVQKLNAQYPNEETRYREKYESCIY